jgi:hypothetical protein
MYKEGRSQVISSWAVQKRCEPHSVMTIKGMNANPKVTTSKIAQQAECDSF